MSQLRLRRCCQVLEAQAWRAWWAGPRSVPRVVPLLLPTLACSGGRVLAWDVHRAAAAVGPALTAGIKALGSRALREGRAPAPELAMSGEGLAPAWQADGRMREGETCKRACNGPSGRACAAQLRFTLSPLLPCLALPAASALQLLLAVGRAGRFVDRVPHSVIAGFTAGAAILIVTSQVGAWCPARK